jgi:hypothetical protein
MRVPLLHVTLGFESAPERTESPWPEKGSKWAAQAVSKRIEK